jgi:hypothetical protein
MDLDAMGRSGTPFPKNKIGHVRPRPIGEGWYEHACRAVGNQACSQAPGCGFSPVCNVVRPGATQVTQIDAAGSSTCSRRVVDDVRYIDFIRAHRQRIETTGKAMSHFEEHSFNCQGQIQGRHTSRVETSAVRPGAITRERRESPLWIVCAITCSLEPQAKPPNAT